MEARCAEFGCVVGPRADIVALSHSVAVTCGDRRSDPRCFRRSITPGSLATPSLASRLDVHDQDSGSRLPSGRPTIWEPGVGVAILLGLPPQALCRSGIRRTISGFVGHRQDDLLGRDAVQYEVASVRDHGAATGRFFPKAAIRIRAGGCERRAEDGQFCTIVSTSPWASSCTRTTCLGTPETSRVVKAVSSRSSSRRTGSSGGNGETSSLKSIRKRSRGGIGPSVGRWKRELPTFPHSMWRSRITAHRDLEARMSISHVDPRGGVPAPLACVR